MTLQGQHFAPFLQVPHSDAAVAPVRAMRQPPAFWVDRDAADRSTARVVYLAQVLAVFRIPEMEATVFGAHDEHITVGDERQRPSKPGRQIVPGLVNLGIPRF